MFSFVVWYDSSDTWGFSSCSSYLFILGSVGSRFYDSAFRAMLALLDMGQRKLCHLTLNHTGLAKLWTPSFASSSSLPQRACSLVHVDRWLTGSHVGRVLVSADKLALVLADKWDFITPPCGYVESSNPGVSERSASDITRKTTYAAHACYGGTLLA